METRGQDKIQSREMRGDFQLRRKKTKNSVGDVGNQQEKLNMSGGGVLYISKQAYYENH